MQSPNRLFHFHSSFCLLWDLSSCKCIPSFVARINTYKTNDLSSVCLLMFRHFLTFVDVFFWHIQNICLLIVKLKLFKETELSLHTDMSYWSVFSLIFSKFCNLFAANLKSVGRRSDQVFNEPLIKFRHNLRSVVPFISPVCTVVQKNISSLLQEASSYKCSFNKKKTVFKPRCQTESACISGEPNGQMFSKS